MRLSPDDAVFWRTRAKALTPAVLAFALLAVQIAIPWTVPHLITQDGPSHIYGATITRELLLHHPSSVYSSVYTLQRAVLPNWTSSIALAVAALIVGVNHAEQLFMSMAALAGFLGWCYAIRALSPEHSPWTPVVNFLIQTWFFWTGYYNFYLGMLLLGLPIGFYVRNIGRLTFRRSVGLAAGLVALFFTHVIPAAIAVATIAIMAVWVRSPSRIRELGMLAGAVIPAIALIWLYLHGAAKPSSFDSQLAWAWRDFPMHVFTVGGGRSGAQVFLWPCILFFIAAGIFSMTRLEWRSARGGIVIATLLVFMAYLFTPDSGFSGGGIKIRLSWGVFLLGGMVACSVSRLRVMQIPLAIWVACFLFSIMLASIRLASAVNNAAQDYLKVASRMAPKSSFVRLHYPTPRAPEQYGYENIGSDPLFHLDAFAAARGQLVDLSDYEAPSKIFPVVYKRKYESFIYALWGFEGPDNESAATLSWLNENLPAPIDYVLLVGDEDSAEAIRAGMPKMSLHLNSSMRPIAESSNRLVRLYARRDLPVKTKPPEF